MSDCDCEDEKETLRDEIAALRSRAEAAEAEVVSLITQIEVAQSFHKVAVAERDRERSFVRALEERIKVSRQIRVAAEARSERLEAALLEASDVCAQEYTVDNQRSMDRVMRVISLALHPTARADEGGKP